MIDNKWDFKDPGIFIVRTWLWKSFTLLQRSRWNNQWFHSIKFVLSLIGKSSYQTSGSISLLNLSARLMEWISPQVETTTSRPVWKLLLLIISSLHHDSYFLLFFIVHCILYKRSLDTEEKIVPRWFWSSPVALNCVRTGPGLSAPVSACGSTLTADSWEGQPELSFQQSFMSKPWKSFSNLPGLLRSAANSWSHWRYLPAYSPAAAGFCVNWEQLSLSSPALSILQQGQCL